MAWHSKRHNIKHRKAAQDAKKSQAYAKVGKIIQMAARNGSDPFLNPALESALIKARQAGLPKDVIQKAIDKGAWNVAGEELQEIYYEGYGPGGVALYIKTLTSNSKRTWANLRTMLTRGGGNLGEPGSVSRQFKEKGEIYINGKAKKSISKGNEVVEILPLVQEEIENDILETTAQDFEIEEGSARVVTSKEDYLTILHSLEKQSRNIEDAGLIFLPENELVLDEEKEEKLQRLIEELEDDEDVDTVFHNAG